LTARVGSQSVDRAWNSFIRGIVHRNRWNDVPVS
jgi:hypothetical protein